MKKAFKMLSTDGKHQLQGYVWRPDNMEPKAVVQLVHGMVEHIERYDEFATRLTMKGYLVIGYDHLGHGNSVISKEEYGYFAKEQGHNLLIQDIRRLYKKVKKTYPKLPYFLMGHSMGSFLVRRYLTVYGGQELTGTIIMGTGRQRFPVVVFGVTVAQVLKKWKGDQYRSFWMNQLAFGGYNRKFKNTRGNWLSKDEEKVREYFEDERCQFIFTVGAYQDLFQVLCEIERKKNLQRMSKDLPILLVSGEEDPVGDFGKGVRSVYKQYQKLGMKDVELKLYPNDRHEILNELDRECVYQDLYDWMEKKIENSQFQHTIMIE